MRSSKAIGKRNFPDLTRPSRLWFGFIEVLLPLIERCALLSISGKKMRAPEALVALQPATDNISANKALAKTIYINATSRLNLRGKGLRCNQFFSRGLCSLVSSSCPFWENNPMWVAKIPYSSVGTASRRLSTRRHREHPIFGIGVLRK
jgi:hypothetical protein